MARETESLILPDAYFRSAGLATGCRHFALPPILREEQGGQIVAVIR